MTLIIVTGLLVVCFVGGVLLGRARTQPEPTRCSRISRVHSMWQATKSHRRLWFVLAGVALTFAALMGACAYAFSRLDASLDRAFDPNQTPGIYKPIPVATSACPYLRRVHDTAARSARLWVVAAFGNSKAITRSTVNQALTAFDNAMTVALPRVPEKVREQLLLTQQQVQQGEREVVKAASVHEYGLETWHAVNEGNSALGNASDLVGNACGFRLKPHIDIAHAMEPTTIARSTSVPPSGAATSLQQPPDPAR
jgi:hypothetical protein